MVQADALMPFFDESRKGAKVRPDQTLEQALLAAQRLYGGAGISATDSVSGGFSMNRLIARARLLSRLLERETGADETRIGLMLPTAGVTLTCFFGVQLMGRVVTMLNFNSGLAAVISACRTATLKTVLTSRAFVERANLGALVGALEETGIRFLYVEELVSKATVWDKIRAAFSFRRSSGAKADDPAVVLFTSGSEGEPKGVVLSHRNVLSNIAQYTSRLDVGAWDHMFCCLPLYHSFGLTVGALLPLLCGMKTTYHSSPLHYHEVPKLIRESGATLILTTDTFLTGYARMGTKEDFASLRYIVSGAEKLKDQTRNIWADQFGKVIFEGYGVTETAPVLCLNTPDAFGLGSVGRVLPGIDAEIRPVEGIAEGGELCVRGPNVMLGYIRSESPGVLVPLADGWHRTGDIVEMDENGFVSIKGRIKRFAKIGGEMISLGAIEQAIARFCPGVLHAVVSVPHARRGEAVILVTEKEDVDTEALRRRLRAEGVTELAVPRRVISVSKMPVLGSGKIDYIGARLRAMEAVAPSPEEAVVEKIA